MIEVKKKKYIIMLKNESAYERILDEEGYLVNDIDDAWLSSNKDHAEVILNELDYPEAFEVKELEISYKF